MATYRLKLLPLGLLVGGLLAMPLDYTHAQEGHDLSKIPAKVMDALKVRFPQAEILKWTRAKEGDIIVYDFEVMQNGRKFEADIKEDGSIHNWERAIPIKDLPDAVRMAAETRYPKGILKEIMLITAMKNGKETPDGYEIILETTDEEEVEITVSPDGKILEDPGKKK